MMFGDGELEFVSSDEGLVLRLRWHRDGGRMGGRGVINGFIYIIFRPNYSLKLT